MHQYSNLLCGIAWMWGLTWNNMMIASSAHHQNCVWMFFSHPPTRGSLSPTPSVLYPLSTLYHPLPCQCPRTIPFTTQQFSQKLSLSKIASPANHRNGFWAGSQVPFNHTAKTEATGSHQPTYMYVRTYLHTYIRIYVPTYKKQNWQCRIYDQWVFYLHVLYSKHRTYLRTC